VAAHDRQCLIAGTTNLKQWMGDETGGRRWWGARCGDSIDLGGIVRDRDQIWAEALAAYRAGEQWWLEDEDLGKPEQDADPRTRHREGSAQLSIPLATARDQAQPRFKRALLPPTRIYKPVGGHSPALPLSRVC
jgi:hypothetical protein